MDSYELLGVNKDSSDKEIEVAYLDLKKKYDPSFNTSIHAYKKYREIQKAYENIKDEQRRKMYDLKDNVTKTKTKKKEYFLYDFESKKETVEQDVIDYSKVEDFYSADYSDIEVKVDVSYLYYILNLRYDLEYYHNIKCKECNQFIVCDACEGKKVVECQDKLIYCPVCNGEGKLSVDCKCCGDNGFVLSKNNISFYIDEEIKEFKGLGNEYADGVKSNLKVIFNFYDKESIKVSEDLIEVNYYLNEKETVFGINKEFFTELGAFKLEVNSFVENGYKKEIVFNNKKIVFTFFNEKYNGKDKEMYLFINRQYKDKFVYFSEDYSVCSTEEKIDCNIMVKCSSKIIIENKGEEGKYGGANGHLIINVIFNSEDELIYSENVKVIHTSKLFNLLGGQIEGFNHFGFKKENCLIRKKDFYYLLTGDSQSKFKLKDYFLFKTFSAVLWCLLPLLVIVIPYSQTMFMVLVCVMLAYLVISNILMELEV